MTQISRKALVILGIDENGVYQPIYVSQQGRIVLESEDRYLFSNLPLATIASEINGLQFKSGIAKAFNDNWEARDAARIFNESNLTAAEAAKILDNSLYTAQVAGLMASHNNLSTSKLNSIFNDTNLTIVKGQAIIDNMPNPTRLQANNSRIATLGDDWADVKLTSRDKADTVDSALDMLAITFRPEWTTIGGTPSAGTGYMDLGKAASQVYTPSNTNTGTWMVDFYMSGGAGNKFLWRFMQDTQPVANRTNYIEYEPSSTSYLKAHHYLYGTFTVISFTNFTLTGTLKVTRDGSGKFEVFVGSGLLYSQGTGIDTHYTGPSIHMSFQNASGVDITLQFSNLKVHPT